MPSFDITSDLDWQEVDNAIQQALKETSSRFDFKGIKTEITPDKKAKTVLLWISVEEKLDALKDVFYSKLVKRGVSLLAFTEKTTESASSGGARCVLEVLAGVSKEKGKDIIQKIKEAKFKAQAQIQDEQVRVTAKSRDELQEVIAYLKQNQDQLKVPMQFANFRD
jgi:uncharacterized protein YajQ (UPF0234 family)